MVGVGMTEEHVIYYDDLEKNDGVISCPFCENDQFYVDIVGMEPYAKVVSRTCENCYSAFPLIKPVPVSDNREY